MQDLADLDDIADQDDKYNKVLDAIYELREISEELSPLLEKFQEEAGKVA